MYRDDKSYGQIKSSLSTYELWCDVQCEFGKNWYFPRSYFYFFLKWLFLHLVQHKSARLSINKPVHRSSCDP